MKKIISAHRSLRLEKPNRERGFMTLDTMGGIAVIIILLAIIGGTAWLLKSKSKSNSALSQLNILTVNTPGLRTTSGYGTGSLLSALSVSGSLPPDMTRGGTSAAPTTFNVWGGRADVVGTNSGFRIEWDGVPQAECMTIVPKTAQSGQYDAVTIGSAGLTRDSALSDFQSACTSNSGGKVNVVWQVEG